MYHAASRVVSKTMLCGQATFPQLYQELQLHDSALWSTYSRSSQCEQELPSFVCKKLSAFQQLLVVQATRPDRLQSAMSQFACNALGTVCLSVCLSIGVDLAGILGGRMASAEGGLVLRGVGNGEGVPSAAD